MKDPKGIIQNLLKAIEMIERNGCIDHIDCASKENQELWYKSIEQAKEYIKLYKTNLN